LFCRSIWNRTKNSPDYRQALVWLFATLFIWFLTHSQIVAPLTGVYADRWFYMAFWIVLAVLFLFVQNLEVQRQKIFLRLRLSLLLLLIPLVFMTVQRARLWQDPLNLYQTDLKHFHRSAFYLNNAGVELFRRNRWLESLDYFQKSAEQNPYWNVPLSNFGAAKEKHGKFSEAEILYKRALALSFYPLAAENLAKLLYSENRFDEFNEFLKTIGLVYLPKNETLLKIESLLKSRKK
jgi:tetratricopeptide (TPR) repeat protein